MKLRIRSEEFGTYYFEINTFVRIFNFSFLFHKLLLERETEVTLETEVIFYCRNQIT